MPDFFCCAIRDSAIDAFGTPIFVVATGAAVRSFSDEINREGSVFGAHPADYELYLLGRFNDGSGLLSGGPPTLLVRGQDLVKEK